MSNNDLNNTLRGYWLVNSLIGNAARHLAEENRKIEKEKLKQDLFNSHYQTKEQLADKIGRYILSEQTETAYDFLNKSLREELIHDCQNQKSFTTPLSELIVQRKEKYRPFYEKLGRKIPARIDNITAEELCFIMDKDLLSHECK